MEQDNSIQKMEETISTLLQEITKREAVTLEQYSIMKCYLEYAYAIGLEQGGKRVTLGSFNQQTKSKRVVRMTMDGRKLQPYRSISHAARIFGVDRSSIHKVIKGKNKTCKGYKWAYES